MKKKIPMLLLTALIMSLFPSISLAKTPFSRTNMPAQLKITTSALNIRSGPGTSFKKVGLVYQNQLVECIGKLGTWYIIHTDGDIIGVISSTYAKPYYPPTSQPAPQPSPAPTPQPSPQPEPQQPSSQIGQEEQKMLDLINAERAKIGVQPLKADLQVMNVAKIKAEDMVKNNYFSHTSPTYGSPFDMLKKFGVSYNYAGENIAGNSTVEAAHTALMNSEEHRNNILNPNYNYIGIGIADSPKYGKIFVQMFIGK